MSFKISFGKDPGLSKTSSILGALLCFGLSILGLYVALFGNKLSGGVPFLPDEVNTLMGRITFGSGALFTFWLFTYALREFLRKVRTEKDSKK
ncbi:MAG: hypothetical protein EA391_12085 [Balneolaceae bacterium]|nr:MAG: hypothetical protein EA391_12085 [Balneolaceae bacterium]